MSRNKKGAGASSSKASGIREQDAPTTLVPRLRFPEFRDSEGWHEVPVREVANVTAGQSPRSEYYNDTGDGTPFYQGKTDFGDVFIDPPTKWTTQITRIANEGDILMSVRAPVGALNVSTQDICVGRGLAALQPKEHKRFFYYLLLQVNHLFVGNGGSVFDSINRSQIESTQIPFPATDAEQRKIASCLRTLDERIAAEGRKLAALREHKKGLMQQLFPSEGETQPRLRFPEFQDAREWEKAAIGQLGTVVTGNTPLTKQRDYYGGRHLFVSPSDMSDFRFVHTTQTTLSDLGFAQARAIPARSVLFVCIGSTIGKVSQNFDVCATNQQINAVIPKAEQSGDFLYFLLSFASTDIAAAAGKQAVPIINKSSFSNIEVLVPLIEEQQRIADCLSALDALIAAQAEKIAVLRTHKHGLMQQFFPPS